MAQKKGKGMKERPGPVKTGKKTKAKTPKKPAGKGTFSADKFARAKKKVFGI